jgi:photosystem II stability/assembly factor-like uncharacterized protein
MTGGEGGDAPVVEGAGGHAVSGGTSGAGTSEMGGAMGVGGTSKGQAGTTTVSIDAGHAAGSGGGGGSGVRPTASCSDPMPPALPSSAPALSSTAWTNISPKGPPYGDNGTIALGIAVDPCDPAVLYDCVTSYDPAAGKGGVYKSTDAGTSWNRVGSVPENTGGSDHIDNPIRIRVDPKNPAHLFVADGVRGGSTGFWVSTDGGQTFTMPKSFKDLKTDQGIYAFDVYDVAPDPTDFHHILLTFHSAWGWTDTKWNTQSGILESTDGGDSWIVHPPQPGWGSGNVANFLFEPSLGIGNGKTWLFGSPGGLWRTDNAGQTWTKVSEAGVQHGGGTIYYTKKGELYAAGGGTNLKSTDNGVTWAEVGASKGYNAIFGDGTRLYTAPCFGPTPFMVSAETDGKTWTAFNAQQFDQGPYEMAIDSINGILYSSSWGSGVWALKPGR